MIKFEIIGTGAYVPEKILTNADLEKMVDTSDEWITTRTGIKERRTRELLKQMTDKELILKQGQARSTHYILKHEEK